MDSHKKHKKALLNCRDLFVPLSVSRGEKKAAHFSAIKNSKANPMLTEKTSWNVEQWLQALYTTLHTRNAD